MGEDTRILAHRMKEIVVSEWKVYDVNEQDVIIDFTYGGNSEQFMISGFYGAEEDGRWAQPDAEVAIRLADCDVLKLDMFHNWFADDTTIKFNEEIVWTSENGVDSLSNIVVMGELIKENEDNCILITTEAAVKSPKEQGISEDTRTLAHRMRKIIIGKYEDSN